MEGLCQMAKEMEHGVTITLFFRTYLFGLIVSLFVWTLCSIQSSLLAIDEICDLFVHFIDLLSLFYPTLSIYVTDSYMKILLVCVCG